MLIASAPAGTVLDPLLQAWYTACQRSHESVWRADVSALPDVSRAVLARLRRPDELALIARADATTCDIEELRERAAGLVELCATGCDIFICGDAAALQTTARLALVCRERGVPDSFVLLPCCPYNSVPFNGVSAGFASALTACVQTVDAMAAARRRDRNCAPIGVVYVAGDTAGWLAVGAAALCADAGNAFCLIRGCPVDIPHLCGLLTRTVASHGSAVVVIGDDLIDGARRRLAADSNAQLDVLRDTIARQTRMGVAGLRCDPGVGLPSNAGVPGERMLGAQLARAAVRAARTQRVAALVAVQTLPHDTLPWRIAPIPLLEAVAAPRQVPERYLRSGRFQPASPCARELSGLIASTRGRRA